MQTLGELAKKWCVPPWTARRVYDRLRPDGPRAGLYRLVRDEDIAELELACRAALDSRPHRREVVSAN